MLGTGRRRASRLSETKGATHKLPPSPSGPSKSTTIKSSFLAPEEEAQIVVGGKHHGGYLEAASTLETYDSYSDDEEGSFHGGSLLAQRAVSKMKERRSGAQQEESVGVEASYDLDVDNDSVESSGGESFNLEESWVTHDVRTGGSRQPRGLPATVIKYLNKPSAAAARGNAGRATEGALPALTPKKSNFTKQGERAQQISKKMLRRSKRNGRPIEPEEMHTRSSEMSPFCKRMLRRSKENGAKSASSVEEKGGGTGERRHQKVKELAVRTRKEKMKEKWEQRQRYNRNEEGEEASGSSQKENDANKTKAEGPKARKTFLDFVEHLLVEVDAANGVDGAAVARAVLAAGENTPDTSVGSLPRVEDVGKAWPLNAYRQTGSGNIDNVRRAREAEEFLGGPDLPKPVLRRFPTSPIKLDSPAAKAGSRRRFESAKEDANAPFDEEVDF